MKFSFRRQFSAIVGRATTLGTQNFVRTSSLPLYHCLEQAKLYVNPIIHGAPTPSTLTQEDSEICFAEALLKNRSNCLYVYNHSGPKKAPWTIGATALRDILDVGNVDRAEIVTVAGLGKVTNNVAEQIASRLKEAKDLSNLAEIDIAIVEFDDDSFNKSPNCLDETIVALEGACSEGQLATYGLHINVAPYSYHTPPLRLTSNLAMLPPLIEDSLTEGKAPHGDIVMYAISPTTALPATYPMLDPNPDDYDLAAIESKLKANAPSEGENEEGEIVDTELTGGEKKRRFTRIASGALSCRRGRGKATDSLQDDLQRQAEHASSTEESTENLNSQINATESRDSHNLDEMAHSDCEGGAETVPLLSHSLPPRLEQHLGEALDTLCPPLVSTPLLQTKALRIVMSVGIDAVMLDAELSARMGKVTLGGPDLLTSAETDDIFGTFALPAGLIKSS